MKRNPYLCTKFCHRLHHKVSPFTWSKQKGNCQDTSVSFHFVQHSMVQVSNFVGRQNNFIALPNEWHASWHCRTGASGGYETWKGRGRASLQSRTKGCVPEPTGLHKGCGGGGGVPIVGSSASSNAMYGCILMYWAAREVETLQASQLFVYASWVGICSL